MPGSIASGSQSGFSFQDSLGSGYGETTVVRPGQEDDVLEERAFSHGAMGVMYTVCKEKARYGPLFIAFRLLADWLQLWLLVVQPPQFDLPPDKLWWQIINFIGLNQFMAARGYTFFLVCFYLLVIGLLLSVGLSIWVGWSFQQNRFDHVWPIIILRWFAKIFYQMLDIMSMSLFLMALDCQMFCRPADMIGYNQEFPDVNCWSMPHIVHVFVAVISLILFLMLAGAFTVGEMELDFTTHNQLAIMHTGVELWTFIIRVLMTFVSVLVYNPKWACMAQLFLSCWLVGLVWYWQLQLEGWVNHVRVGMYTSVTWCSVLYVISAFNLGWDASDAAASQKSVHALTIVMWLTTIPMGCLGAWASRWRLNHLSTTVLNKFRPELPEDLKHVDEVHEFHDSRFAEVLARCCRVWVTKHELQPDGVVLAEKVLQVGLAQMPKDPFMVILYSSFLMDVQNSYQSGYTQLQAAKKLDLSFLMRFAIFSREQQHAQRSAAGSGGNRAADLVSYVEFQRNYSMALKVHRETLVNMTRFWECLLHKNVRFRTLSDTVKAMDSSIRQAERVYKNVLQRHASSVKIVRLYAKFLEQVKQDPWGAARWFSEAERLEVAEDELKRYDALSGVDIDDPAIQAALAGAGAAGNVGAGAAGRAVIVLNANNIITLASPACHTLLGYTKTELVNKSLRMILPPAIGDNHARYVRNYISTGRSAVIGNTFQQMAVHKDKYMVPIYLSVSKISGIGEDTTFMGILEPVAMQSEVASMWVMPDASVLTVSSSFTDWFAWTAKEVHGQPLANLLGTGAKDLHDILQLARTHIARQSTSVIPKPSAAKAPFLFSMRMNQHTSNDADKAPLKHIASDMQGSLMLASPIKTAMDIVSTESSSSLLALKPSIDSPALDAPLVAQEWTVPSVSMAHKYAFSTECEVSVVNAGVGSFSFHVLTIKKKEHRADTAYTRGISMSLSGNVLCSPTAVNKPSQRLMLVANSKGQVLHVTSGLASLLGRTLQSGCGCVGLSVIEQVIAKPFGSLHKTLVQGTQPMSIPPYSCRAGLSVLLQGQGPQGQPLLHPAKLAISKKVTTDDTLHVVLVQDRSMEQALAERRLLLELDGHGVVTTVDADTPASLFGCEPDKLLGKHACSFLDVLRPPGMATSAELDLIEQEHALTVLLEMAAPALQSGSSCWRVGFITPETAVAGNAENRATAKVRGLLSAVSKPTMMRLKVLFADVGNEEATPGVTIQMELWRADICTSVIEVDKDGVVQPPEFDEVGELYPPDLVLGTSLDDMLDQNISTFIADLANRPVADLMSAGAFGSIVQAGAAKRAIGHRSSLKAPAADPATLLGAMAVAGPPHALSVVHHQDQSELKISVQAVRRQGLGAQSSGLYLILHAIKPTSGRPDFQTWLNQRLVKTATDAGPMEVQARLKRLSSALASAPRYLTHAPDAPYLSAVDGLLRSLPAPSVVQTVKRAEQASEATIRPPSGEAGSPFRRQRATQGASSDADADRGSDAKTRAPDDHEMNEEAHDTPAGQLHAKNMDRISSWVTRLESPRVHATATGQQLVLMTPAPELTQEMSVVDATGVAADAAAPANATHAPDELGTEVADSAAQDMEEADYKRGQRFKRLYAVLAGTLVQAPINTFRKQAFLIAALICVVQVACFAVMYMLIDKQRLMVSDLFNIGVSGITAAELVLQSRSFNIFYANMTVPGLHWLSQPSDLGHLKTLYTATMIKFLGLHQGVYLGFGKPRPLPTTLKPLWVDETITVTNVDPILANESGGNFTVDHMRTTYAQSNLWDIGQETAQRAAFLLQNADAYNASHPGRHGFETNADMLWIVNNAPDALLGSYLSTLDAYLEATMSSAEKLNMVQLVVMVVDGIVCCGVLSVWMWRLLQQVAHQRYRVYHIFMIVPLSLLRRLATKQYLLGDEEAEDGDGQERPDVNQRGMTATAASKGVASKQESSKASNGHRMSIHIKTSAQHDATASNSSMLGTWFHALMSCFGLSHKSSSTMPKTKRRLLPCNRTTVWLLWPILLWGGIVVTCGSLGFMLLQATSGPVAMINYTTLLYNRIVFKVQELVFVNDPAQHLALRKALVQDVMTYEREYNVMLHGREYVPQETSKHYTLVTEGLATSSTAADILYYTTDCLCLAETDCNPPDSPIYTDTRQGMDRMVLKFLHIFKNIDHLSSMDPYLTGPEYFYYWNSRMDIKGGCRRTLILSVQVLHIVVLSLTLVLVVAYLLLMLRPFLRVTTYETRRISELLSQLPPEVDVAGVVSATLLPQHPDNEMADAQAGTTLDKSMLQSSGEASGSDKAGKKTTLPPV